MRIVIIANPTAGKGRAYARIERLVRAWPYEGWEAKLIPTRGPEHAGVIARDACSDSLNLLAVCGGDGTLKEVVSSVPDPPVPVALLPAGTANVLARDLGLPLDAVKALEVALHGTAGRVDLGMLTARASHRFLIMAGIGLDAYIVSRIRPAAKHRFGLAAFYYETFRSLLRYPFPEFLVHAGEEKLAATSCVIANSKGYGGGLVFTPEADMHDGLFDVLLVQSRNRMEYLRMLYSAWRRNPRTYPWTARRRASSIRIEGPRGIWAHADGELIGTLPLEIEMLPSAFPLITPS